MSISKERPILFSAPMVRAILEGRKTVTRRAVKASKAHADGFMMLDHGNGWWPYNAFGDFTSDHEGMEYPIAYPYGKPSERLWVRETWADVNLHGAPGIAYRADGDVRDLMEDASFLDEDGAFNYDDPRSRTYQFACWSEDLIGGKEGRWRSSIHMPRWVSRILLEITSVRVERLRDSSDLDLIDELGDMLEDCDSTAGREFSRIEHLQSAGAPLRMLPEMYGFAAFWDEKHGHGSFESNPWVWVVEFKRVTP